MGTPEKNMTNLHDSKTRVTVGDSGALTCTKCGNWHGYEKHDGKIHHVALSDTAIITGLRENLSSMKREPQKHFQLASEGEA